MRNSVPWSSELDRFLYAAVFHPDKDRALLSAQHWFSQVDVAKISYEHHRLIAAVGRRFDDVSKVTNNRAIIRNVSKQLWLRAAQNLRDFEQMIPELHDLRVPFALGGHIVWASSERNDFVDCETLEVVVHHHALGFVLERFCRAGWFPDHGYQFYRGHSRIGLLSSRGVHLALLSSRAACQLTGQSNTAFWQEVTQTTCFGVDLPLLTGWQNMCLRSLRMDDALQLFIDHHCTDSAGTNLRSHISLMSDWVKFWRFRQRLRHLPFRLETS